MDRLEGLIARLEYCLLKIEKPMLHESKNDDDKSASQNDSLLLPVKAALDQYINSCKAIEGVEYLKILSDIGKDTLTMLTATLPQINNTKKPKSELLVDYYKQKVKAVIDSIMLKDQERQYEYCMKAIEDGMKIIFFVLVAEPSDYIKEVKDEFEFCLNKVRMSDKKINSEWLANIMLYIESLKRYFAEKYMSLFNWNENGPEFQITTIHSNVEEKKPIQEVKPIEKEAPKTQLQPKASQPKAKNEPTTTTSGNKTTYSNYVDKTFEFKEGELQMMDALFFSNCKNIKIITKCKLNSISLHSCINVGVEKLVSSLTLTYCSGINGFLINSVSSVVLDSSKDVTMNITKETIRCKFMSTSCSEIRICYPDPQSSDPNEMITKAIPIQFESTVCKGKLSTIPVEMGDE